MSTCAQVVQLEVLGMHCSACSSAVEASLNELPGVLHSSISLILRKANIRIDPSLVTHVSSPGFARACPSLGCDTAL